jgi:hypothetical protein
MAYKIAVVDVADGFDRICKGAWGLKRTNDLNQNSQVSKLKCTVGQDNTTSVEASLQDIAPTFSSAPLTYASSLRNATQRMLCPCTWGRAISAQPCCHGANSRAVWSSETETR